MKKTYKNILMVYVRNPLFLILSSILVLSVIGSKGLMIQNQWALANDLVTLLFVIALWFVFQLGMIVKQQFTNPRASLLPGYSRAHLGLFWGWYGLLLLIAYLWQFGLRIVLVNSSISQWGVFVTCLWVALWITYVGYLSILRVMLYGYLLLTLFALQAAFYVDFLNQNHWIVYGLMAGIFVFVLTFSRRLLSLHEDHFEYLHQLSWPPRKLLVNQVRASESIEQLFEPFFRRIRGEAKLIRIPRYPQQAGLMKRAWHWDTVGHVDLKEIWMVIILSIPVILYFLNQWNVFESFSHTVYNNFCLLTLSPVVVTIGSHYRRLAYWGYDVLRPIKKRQYLSEQVFILVNNLVLYWTLFVVAFVLIPCPFFNPGIFAETKFWVYLLLTFHFSLLVLCWLAFLSAIKNSTRVLVHGTALFILGFLLFYAMPALKVPHLLWVHGVTFILMIIFFRGAFKAWMENEF